MKTYKVTFSNGDSLVTSMNATVEEAKAYYFGNIFNFGDTEERPYDVLVSATSLEEVA